jgi:hypothetical protein
MNHEMNFPLKTLDSIDPPVDFGINSCHWKQTLSLERMRNVAGKGEQEPWEAV